MTLTTQIAAFLAAAVVMVPLFRRGGLGAILGYLAAGMLLGPFGLKVVANVDAVLHFAELGVVLLLFVIGLELQPSRLWVLRRSVFGLGSLQVGGTALVLTAAGWALGLTPAAAAIAGLGLALSSTAFVLQMLAEKNQLTTRHGREAFAILLFQDLAVIPVLVLLPLLGGGKQLAVHWGALAIGVGSVVAVVVGGHYLLRPALRLVAKSGSNEAFTAAALLLVLGTALLMEHAGLSMSLGAFLAGVLLADSEYRHELEADIEPFKGLLLGLFFIAVGMSANLGLLAAHPLLLLGLTLALMAAKFALLYVIGRATGANDHSARHLGVALAQGGEFAFVLFNLATQQGVMGGEHADLLVLVVTLSMAATPLIALVHERWVAPVLARKAPREFDQITPHETSRVIIAGFGRFGQIVARMLRMKKIRFTALEVSPDQVDFVRRFGNKVFYGDASRLDLLRAAGADKAELFVLAIDDVEASIKTAQMVREHFPALPIYARARNRFHAYRLMDLGINVMQRETLLSSVALGRQSLEALGVDSNEAEKTAATFVLQDEMLLERQHATWHDETQLIQTTRDAMKELESLFESDDGSKH
ncbi:Kef-type potassium/proton antiporter, CPA2 family [Andreprevotia lacus DSM 23236]|jgi:glutathione-regulated potassium-efflux system ancillary protein KefC/glutathione-regulated potassium-efflux system protein KefB|uniref:Kef-type potassium/proton antiporter, CPA2 family n=1 Tax=Andreprevotia lacus DSM 23236 TaxID=1121001 RepID=A0A1W1X905_9NEIS|nr:monovalent cation:proton antiporter-2 (CPA2) family protein [Andreprevotia lacus]SMC20416.1 Kef-type potassium/proton antiporter, CPA2 family [Andreprevotia lacus DSM 23236]